MKTLTRYIMTELVIWFSISLFVLTLIILIFVAGREAFQSGLPIMLVLGLIPYILPDALRFAIPGTLLLATTSVYGRLSGWNEIVAMKAQGISPWKMLCPMWIFVFFVSLAAVYLNDLAVSWGRQGAQRYIVESVEQIAYGVLQTQKNYSSPNFSITVQEVEGKKLIQPVVTIKGQDDKPSTRIIASEARLESDRELQELKIVLFNGSISFGGKKYEFPNKKEEVIIPLRKASNKSDRSDSPSEIAMREIPSEIEQQKQWIDTLQKRMLVQTTKSLVTGDFDELCGGTWRSLESQLAEADNRLAKLFAEPHRRWSAGFSCLCFAFVGAPMAIRLRNRDMLTSFFLCFMPILIVYYPLLAMSINGAKDGRFPPSTVWLGNILLIIWGAYLLRKVVRY
ncbi:MAG: LptF/LptG family permease [Planctomycetia bacterium]|jgi:lipopolysaccharide export system permease protein